MKCYVGTKYSWILTGQLGEVRRPGLPLSVPGLDSRASTSFISAGRPGIINIKLMQKYFISRADVCHVYMLQNGAYLSK